MPKQQRAGVEIYIQGAVGVRVGHGSPGTAAKRSAGTTDPLRDAIEHNGLHSVANTELGTAAVEPPAGYVGRGWCSTT